MLLALMGHIVATASALAAPSGEVVSIGFQNVFRPDTWTPMLVRLRAGEGESGTYQLQVLQEDGDRDRVLFTRTISLTSGAGDQRFWTYFIPQSGRNKIGGSGLPDVNQAATLTDLQSVLKVYLADEQGTQIAQLPISALLTNIEGPQDRLPAIGSRLVLVVSTSQAAPIYSAEAPPLRTLVGYTEGANFISLRVEDLPENPLGYSGVDAIVWADAIPLDPSQSADAARLAALRQYVSAGGRLAVVHRQQWQELDRFADLLPVTFPQFGTTRGAVRVTSLAPLIDLPTVGELWSRTPVNVPIGIAEARPTALVTDQLNWSGVIIDGTALPPTPLIARHTYGAGNVTYIAIDPTDRQLTSAVRQGWPFFWERVFDWRNDVRVINTTPGQSDSNPYRSSSARDIGASLIKFTELPARGAALIGVAVLFFVGYWLIAGPGLFWLLAMQKRAELNWFVFGAIALAATVFTLAVVRLVLRGAPQLSHVTLVRTADGRESQVLSRFGLYIPRDGQQRLELLGSSPTAPATLSNLPLHWKHVSDFSEFPAYLNYQVPVRDEAGVDPMILDVPYRSTLKKFEARWQGALPVGITGQPALPPPDSANLRLTGKLTSNFPTDLTNVYFVYTRPAAGFSRTRDHIFFLPTWKAGATLDLAQLTNTSNRTEVKIISNDVTNNTARPESGLRLYGVIGQPGASMDWDRYWLSAFQRNLSLESPYLDSEDGLVNRSFPMLSLFDRLPPMSTSTAGSEDRADILRRGARDFDVSAAVAGGALVVLATSPEAPLPIDFSVNGDVVGGSGRVYWQFVLPLDRSADSAPQLELAPEPVPQSAPEPTQP